MKSFGDITNKDIFCLKGDAERLLFSLFPIQRSLAGKGVRKTFTILKKYADFKILEIPSGKNFYGWTTPVEWNAKEAFIEDAKGNRIVDFKNNNLHLINHSKSVDKILTYKELISHLHTLPNLPNAIPYRTSYYDENWGFCLAYNQYKKLKPKEKYRVKIIAEFKKGSMSIGEKIIKGKSTNEYLLSTYSCHPQMANDNLSGMVLWVLLLKLMQSNYCHNSYRFVIGPETIGAISYLHQNEKAMKNNRGGFVITTVAGPDDIGYKKSFIDNGEIDVAVFEACEDLGIKPIIYPFNLMGSDERQYSSPFFRIPTGTITKSKYYEYDNYHTSLDNLNFISVDYLLKTLKVYVKAIQNLEKNIIYKSTTSYSEPRLGDKNLYPKIGGSINTARPNRNCQTTLEKNLNIIKWLFFYGDGKHSLKEVAYKINKPYLEVLEVYNSLIKKSLLTCIK